MKTFVQMGWKRRIIILIVVTLVLFVLKRSISAGYLGLDALLDAMQKVAPVPMGFVVAAFHLRFKTLDLFLKDYFSVSEKSRLKQIVVKRNQELSEQIILATATSAWLAMLPLFKGQDAISGYLSGAGIASFFVGLTLFTFLIMDFDELEDKFAECEEEATKERERRRQLEGFEQK